MKAWLFISVLLNLVLAAVLATGIYALGNGHEAVLYRVVGRQMPEPNSGIEYPLEIFDSFVPSCPDRGNDAQSPDAYEMPSFRTRFNSGTTSEPIAIQCIIAEYSPGELVTWREKGDPVAQYADLTRRYPNIQKACNDRQKIEDTLLRIAEHQVTDEQGRTLTRVPDAYLAAAQLRALCRVPGAKAFATKARQAGLVIVVHTE